VEDGRRYLIGACRSVRLGEYIADVRDTRNTASPRQSVARDTAGVPCCGPEDVPVEFTGLLLTAGPFWSVSVGKCRRQTEDFKKDCKRILPLRLETVFNQKVEKYFTLS
jgi:hypothetical protein